MPPFTNARVSFAVAPDGRTRLLPAVSGLLRPAGQPVEVHLGPVVGRCPAGEVAEALVRLVRDDAEVGPGHLLVERVEARIDPFAADPPRAQPVLPVVGPPELVADLVQAAVDEQAVLGDSGAVGPFPAELDRPARRGACRPVPRDRVRPL